VAELNRREVIQSMGDRDWLVISRDEFDYWSNFDLSGFGLIDEQRKYLCRHKLRDLMKKIKLQDVEIGILVKIILQIEKYWDGHLSRLNLLDKEWEIVRSLRCGDEGINHADCFYENKFCSSGKKVMTWPVLEELKARGKTTENLWYWVNDETLEDGMTELTEVRVGRWLWEEMFDDLQVVPGMRRSQLDGLRKQMEMMWGMAGWLIKSQGVDNGMTQGLDFTPTLYQDLSVVPVVKVVKDILRQWEDMNPVGWKQNLRFGFRNMHIFLKNWLGQGDWMMSGKIINGELSFSLSKINFRDLLEEKSVERLILAAPVVFFAEKMYAYRLFFDQQETMKMAKSWDVRLEIDYRQSGEVIDLDNLDELPNSLLVFSSRDKGEDWLEKIKDKPYYGQVNNLLVGRKNLMAKLTGWSVINFHNLRYLRKTLNQFDQIYLDSLPFDVPDSLSIGYRSIYYGESSFQNYYLPRMYNRLFGLVHFIKPGGQLVVGDSRLWEKEYGKKIIEVFNDRK